MKAKQDNNNKKTLKRLFVYIKRRMWLMILSVLLSAGFVILSLYIPVLTGRIIDCCIGKGEVDFEGISQILVRLVFCIGGAALAQWLLSVCNNRAAYMVSFEIRNDAFSKLNRLPVGFFDSHAHGDILSRLSSDVEHLTDGLLMGFTNLFSGVLTILVTLIFMVMLNPVITIVVVVVTPLSLFISSFIAKKTYAMFRLSASDKGEQTAYINEMIENAKAVSAYDMHESVQNGFDNINDRLAKHSLKATFFSSLVNPCTRFVNSLVYAGVGCFGALFALKTNDAGVAAITVGELTAFLSYAGKYTKPFNEISGVITEFQNAFACAGRVFEFMDENELAPVRPAEAKEFKKGEPVVSFDNVSFSYVPDRPLIKGFSLDVYEGEKIAIVGPTGCGKTTMINLLMRFYDVSEGSIRLYGRDIRTIPREELREQISMVLQDTWIRNGTVRDNIALKQHDASDEEIVEAAKSAHAWSFIKRMHKGMDTVLSGGTGDLSQGQRQLLCIARVMLDTPPILILDEATSSIDTRTEIRIQKAFAEMTKGRTSFIVAHRLSTIMEADKIIVMKDGDIVETGNHKSLMDKKGFYYNLYTSQF